VRSININRQKLGLEDLTFGVGTETQTRAGQSVVVTKINAGNLPFDETRSLLEWAQSLNLEELGNMSAELQALYNNLTMLGNVEDNLVMLNSVEDNLTELLQVNENAAQVAADKIIVNADKLIVSQDKIDITTMKSAVESMYDSFDDRFLGAKLNDPTVDNDGNPLVDGALYFNSSSHALKVYSLTDTTWYIIPQIYLSGLLDVQLTSITTGDILNWNGSKWVNTRTPKFSTMQLSGGNSTAGTISWNNDELTLDIILNSNVTLQAGQELTLPCKNNSGSTILNGKVVMAVGTTGNSGQVLIGLHDGTKASARRVVGIATEDIINNNVGFVTITGKVRGLNTTGSIYGETWLDNDVLYVKANGALTKVEPLDEDLKMPIAFVLHSHSNGTLLVRTTGIDENHDKDYIESIYARKTVLGGGRNYLINGNFDKWDYASSQTASGYGSDNRWDNANFGSTKVHSSVACTDTERALFNANYFSRTVVSSVAGTNNSVTKYQFIEDVTKLAGKTVTLSFWAKADSNKNIAIDFGQLFGSGGSPSAAVVGISAQKVALTTTWQKKSITVTLPNIVGKTLGTDGVSSSSTYIIFWFDAGSAYNSRTDSLGQQSGTFDITQVKIEDGSVPTDGWHPYDGEFGGEIQACERYYRQFIYIGGSQSFANSHVFTVPELLNMRVTPTLTNAASGAGSGAFVSTLGSATAITYISANSCTASGNIITANVLGNIDNGVGAVSITGTASAEYKEEIYGL